MDEAEWLACNNFGFLLGHLRKKATARKLRLFACACCYRVWHLLQDGPQRQAIQVAEEYADRRATRRDLRCVRQAIPSFAQSADRAFLAAVRSAEAVVADTAWGAVELAAAYAARALVYAERPSVPDDPPPGPRMPSITIVGVLCIHAERALVPLLREIVGNPFRPLAIDPTCRNADVLALAEAAYQERSLPSGELDRARLAILADALEEAGCTEQAILDHLRESGPHVRGCWPLDHVLGRE